MSGIWCKDSNKQCASHPSIYIFSRLLSMRDDNTFMILMAYGFVI